MEETALLEMHNELGMDEGTRRVATLQNALLERDQDRKNANSDA